ncbi:ECF transporter S component [Breznakia pachnodae]|uniref:Riboflavin transporter n=1 Tax=Breznakia pachnodae TaxID=265178 RepID=A0ABU0E194_9FIRM|nr:ECF transporter S component [Breznakia pachnodae]MDQ0360648.1 riboflavin transporter FmnP [Breznakia pachnodae]
MKPNYLQLIVKIAFMAAVAAVVMTFKFATPFAPPFYTIDFSEVIVLLAGFALGPVPAIAVEALKILLNLLLNGTSTMGIGEVANFLMGCSFVVTASVIYHKNKTRKQALIGMGVGVVALCVVASLMNYFVLLPAYAYFFHIPMDALIAQSPITVDNIFTFILIAVVPFNILKGVVSSTAVFLVYKKVTPILKKSI